MKVGILIPCYNRPQYLKKCLWSLDRVELPDDAIILLVDDCSTDKQAIDLIAGFGNAYITMLDENIGIKKVLEHGYDNLFNDHGCDLVINFDSDAIIAPNCVTELIKNYQPGTLLTAFHSTTKSANGDERHIITEEFENVYKKESVGGINFCVDKQAYGNYIEPVLNIEVGNWDHMACLRAGGAYCLKQSLVQHIGFDSSLNHSENPDTADTFYYWDLPDVTLLCIDNNPEQIKEPLRRCTEYIKFGDIQLLHPDIHSKEEYSNFCIDHMHEYIKTSHVLVFQHDGYVHNWQAWDNDSLQYDYIGAPWHYQDGMAVGNGGFSLRSKRLMELCAKIVKIKHPEDHHICRTYRKELEAQGMKFAPVEIAERFAFEGYRQPTKILTDQFGVHGRAPRTILQPPKRCESYVFNQFLSLGDILFLVPMARALMSEGNTVLWPIDKMYLSIAKHFPDIHFVSKDAVNIDYEFRGRLNTQYGMLLPYRFSNELMNKTLKDCMRSKYELFGHNYLMWRDLVWERDYEHEKSLIELLNLPEKFNLVNCYFGHLATMQIRPEIENDLPVVEMRNLEGFTLIDWLGVVEKATEIHVANSSLNYLIELMDLDIPVHLYKRNIWGEQAFEYSDYLFENKCFIFHR